MRREDVVTPDTGSGVSATALLHRWLTHGLRMQPKWLIFLSQEGFPSAPPGIPQGFVSHQLLVSGLPHSAIADVSDKRPISSPAGTGRGSHMRACGGPVARSRSAAAQPRRGRVSCPGADWARSRVLPPGSKAIRSIGARAFSSEDLIVGWHGLRTDRTGSIESNRVTGRDIIERTDTRMVRRERGNGGNRGNGPGDAASRPAPSGSHSLFMMGTRWELWLTEQLAWR